MSNGTKSIANDWLLADMGTDAAGTARVKTLARWLAARAKVRVETRAEPHTPEGSVQPAISVQSLACILRPDARRFNDDNSSAKS